VTDHQRWLVAGDMGDDRVHVAGQAVLVIAGSRPGRGANPAQIGRYDGEVVSESVDEVPPLVPGLRKSMDQDQGRAAACRDEVEVDSIGDQAMMLRRHKLPQDPIDGVPRSC